MKILLVRPPVPKHTIGLKHIMICEPLELEYVAACLEDDEVQIMDLIVEKGFDARLRKFQPDMVVSSCYKTGTNEVIKLFRRVKSWNEECFTIVGGVHATLVPEDFTDPSVDCIGIGDGTLLMPEAVQAINNNESLFDVPGLAFPTSDGQVLKTASRPYMVSADELPFPRRDLVAHLRHKYYYLMHRPVATMKTTWGCWYKCNFCFTWKITGGHPYSRSAESIVRELETIKAKEIYIVDDIFLINRSRLDKIARLIREKNLKKNFLVYSRADFIVKNEDVIEEWSELGLSAVFIGLEAATDDELKSMNKECSVYQNIKAIEILRKYRIDTYGSLIPGPDYEQTDWDNLWKFVKRTGLYYVNISPYTPLPGAEVYDSLKKNLTVPEDAHGLFDLSHQLLPTKMRLKKYYRNLLKLYSRTILNLARARKLTQRTLPSIWSPDYLRILYGTLKIGRQLYYAHNDHTPGEIKIARYKGKDVEGLTYDSKFSRQYFKKKIRKTENVEMASN